MRMRNRWQGEEVTSPSWARGEVLRMRKRNCRETMTSVPRRKKRAPPRRPPPGSGPERGDRCRRGATGRGARARVRSIRRLFSAPSREGGTANPAPSGREPSPPRAALPHPSGPLGGGPRRRAAGGDSIRTARHVVSRRSRRFSSLFVAFRRFSSRRPRPLVARPRREWRSSRFGGLDGPRVTIAEAEA